MNTTGLSPDHDLKLRPADEVMRLERMGSAFPTRLSFMRTLIRRLHREKSAIRQLRADWDGNGYGTAVYSADLGGHTYSLIAYSNYLDPEARSDRVIATAWDATFALFDGIPEAADIDRLRAQVPKQEAGRMSERELVLSRANRSVRLFDLVVNALAQGRQPDAGQIRSTGYLMRTTAVYGNGKFGIADREAIRHRPGLEGSFQAEMLSVYLIRCFTLDLVEHVAKARNPTNFVPLDPQLKRHLGIGNSTGLGMAPFLVSHPRLLHNWMDARETALARVCAIERASMECVERFMRILPRIRAHLDEWQVEDGRQTARIAILRREFGEMVSGVEREFFAQTHPWKRLIGISRSKSLEAQELMVAMVIEPHGALVDDLAERMTAPNHARLEPGMRCGQLRELMQQHAGWAMQFDFGEPAEQAQFWYVSEEKLEPRLGARFEEPGAEIEMPLAIARELQALARALVDRPADETIARFLMDQPIYRYAVRRLQNMGHFPYAEIRDNLISERCLPIDMLRCKLAFFGASKFDPKSDRWTRINMFQGAPLAHELTHSDEDANVDDWSFPALAA